MPIKTKPKIAAARNIIAENRGTSFFATKVSSKNLILVSIIPLPTKTNMGKRINFLLILIPWFDLLEVRCTANRAMPIPISFIAPKLSL